MSAFSRFVVSSVVLFSSESAEALKLKGDIKGKGFPQEIRFFMAGGFERGDKVKYDKVKYDNVIWTVTKVTKTQEGQPHTYDIKSGKNKKMIEKKDVKAAEVTTDDTCTIIQILELQQQNPKLDKKYSKKILEEMEFEGLQKILLEKKIELERHVQKGRKHEKLDKLKQNEGDESIIDKENNVTAKEKFWKVCCPLWAFQSFTGSSFKSFSREYSDDGAKGIWLMEVFFGCVLFIIGLLVTVASFSDDGDYRVLFFSVPAVFLGLVLLLNGGTGFGICLTF